jgi:hypothetical protein
MQKADNGAEEVVQPDGKVLEEIWPANSLSLIKSPFIWLETRDIHEPHVLRKSEQQPAPRVQNAYGATGEEDPDTRGHQYAFGRRSRTDNT